MQKRSGDPCGLMDLKTARPRVGLGVCSATLTLGLLSLQQHLEATGRSSLLFEEAKSGFALLLRVCILPVWMQDSMACDGRAEWKYSFTTFFLIRKKGGESEKETKGKDEGRAQKEEPGGRSERITKR